MTFAFIFPGQGSQSVGMQENLAADHPIVRETYEEASDALGFDMYSLVKDGPKETLDETVNTQPAMLTAGIATWRAWQQSGGDTPAMIAGHSLGEYSALVASGALPFHDTVSLVRKRAELMQDAVPAGEGAMAAIIGLDDEAVIEACQMASENGVAEAANFNTPGQVVVAGDKSGIESLIEFAQAAGARRAMMLAVSVPAHSSLMRSAGETLAALIQESPFSDPTITVISSVDGMPYTGAEDMRARMQAQVYSPVRWVNVINHMQASGVNSIIECGPGKVLAGLVRRIDRSISVACIDSTVALQTAMNGVSE
ncbi:MAG: ACP S-malonyltransferase [Woeseiaceae bacterium]|nr:ACP S-malonyltransferase [Woeseiaceae bacterium]